MSTPSGTVGWILRCIVATVRKAALGAILEGPLAEADLRWPGAFLEADVTVGEDQRIGSPGRRVDVLELDGRMSEGPQYRLIT